MLSSFAAIAQCPKSNKEPSFAALRNSKASVQNNHISVTLQVLGLASKSEEQQQNQGEPSDRQEGPAGQDAQLGAQALLDGARWGNLPARLREALLQGSSDSYSSLYKSMTESYYKRLAEEASE